jgi:hypothetical protein
LKQIGKEAGLYDKETKEFKSASNGLKNSGLSLSNNSDGDSLEELNSTSGIGLELIAILHEVLIRSGSSIKLAIQQNYFGESQNYQINIKKPLSLRESKKQDTNYFKLNSAKSSPAKDIEAFCDEYNEIFKVYKTKEFSSMVSNSATNGPFYIETMIANSKDRVSNSYNSLTILTTKIESWF